MGCREYMTRQFAVGHFWLAFCLLAASVALLSACGAGNRAAVDRLNDQAYQWRYRSLDSTEHYAQQALAAAGSYDDGRAEAMNNLAFVSLVRMEYDMARQQLDQAASVTDNQLELLVSYVQQMRLCQRRSSNREFYDYREKAQRALMRIMEDPTALSERQWRRLVYAESEMAIVTSTYYYYVGLERQSMDALLQITPDIEQDTAQYLNYLYNVGAGGVIIMGTQQEINQQEFDHLMRCFLLSQQTGMAYFAANSLEALAEHFINDEYRHQLLSDNLPAMNFINPSGVTDEQLPLWLADNALATFREYGDTYQIAGAYRTLASCCLAQGDYESALFNLEEALSDSVINQAPDLVASIREQMSVVYAAMDNKAESDRNRNIYLDLQEQTRQDRSLEARAGQLEHAVKQTDRLLWAVVAAIAVLVAVLLFYYRRRKQKMGQPDTDMQEREDELREQIAMMRLRVEKGERRHLEQRAKVSLVNGIMPFIDRILYSIDHSATQGDGVANSGQWSYVRELTDEIEQQNQLLTHWIQLRQGELSLHIETFDMQGLFLLLQKSASSFAMKGITLTVEPTTARVKADRVLTLFMLNTLADNARKFTPEGGAVTVSAAEHDDYVEVSVSDNGCGMDEEQLAHVFDRKVIVDETLPDGHSSSTPVKAQTSHGFGLLNCKGIIDKYRKLSSIFSVCQLSAESRVGEGSRFYFRLPRGVARALSLVWLVALIAFAAPARLAAAQYESPLHRAAICADSAYFSNINGTYERTLLFADSCLRSLNENYLSQWPEATDTLLMMGDLSTTPPEIGWLHDSIDTNFQVLLDIRNESAVAALALHQWTLYQYNNRIYTQLFKEMSADSTLDDYCRKMQQTQTNRQVAIILLVLIFIVIVVAVGWQLMQSLHQSDRRQQEQQDQLDMLADELQKLTMEENALHVSNAVLDNTLSTLKHETMYYPSRIRLMVDTVNSHRSNDTAATGAQSTTLNHALKEVAAYYRELYGMLSAQSMSQVERVKLHLKPLDHGILGDESLVRYLMEILKKENGGQPLTVDYVPRDDKYMECRVAMTSLTRTDLFTPSRVDNIPFLLCRQIVRDHGEATNRRACAITAETAGRGVTIVILLPRSKKRETAVGGKTDKT